MIIHQEHIVIINIYAPYSSRAPKIREAEKINKSKPQETLKN